MKCFFLTVGVEVYQIPITTAVQSVRVSNTCAVAFTFNMFFFVFDSETLEKAQTGSQTRPNNNDSRFINNQLFKHTFAIILCYNTPKIIFLKNDLVS